MHLTCVEGLESDQKDPMRPQLFRYALQVFLDPYRLGSILRSYILPVYLVSKE